MQRYSFRIGFFATPPAIDATISGVPDGTGSPSQTIRPHELFVTGSTLYAADGGQTPFGYNPVGHNYVF